MRINIVKVDVENKDKYRQLDVRYQIGGNEYSKKIVSFGDQKAAFENIITNGVGLYDVTEVKNGKYTNWTEATKISDDAPKSTPTASPRSTYETAEERALRQRLIVRQSSLSNAIEFLSFKGSKTTDRNDVVVLAGFFENYVFNGINVLGNDQSAFAALTKLQDDLPPI